MENCLVIKLKESVNMPELERFGYKRIFVWSDNSNGAFTIRNASNMNVVVMDENYNDTNTHSIETGYPFNLSGVFKSYVDIEKWYNVSKLTLNRCATKEAINTIKSGIFTHLKELTIIYTNVSLNIESLATYTELEVLNIRNANNFTGSLETLLEGIYTERNAGTLTITTNDNVKLNNTFTTSGAVYTVTFSASGCSVSLGGNVVATYDGSSWTYA